MGKQAERVVARQRRRRTSMGIVRTCSPKIFRAEPNEHKKEVEGAEV